MDAKQDRRNVMQSNAANDAYLQTPSRPRRTLPVAKHRQEAVSSPADAAGSGPRRTLPASSSGCTRSTWPPPLASATLESREESKISKIFQKYFECNDELWTGRVRKVFSAAAAPAAPVCRRPPATH